MSNYTTINKSKDYFETTLITGNGSTQNITGLNFQPDWIWYKRRNATGHHRLIDSVRGSNKLVQSDLTNAEGTDATYVTSFNSDGWSIGSNTDVNASSGTTVAWSWLAGGTAPAITYVVKVVSDSGNKYRFDDFGTSAVTLDLQEGGTYTFDQSDSSNSGHPLRFYTAADKTGGEYTTGVTTNGTPGSSGAYTRITVAASAPTLYYQCSNHAGMGGQANTNSTFGSSNFSGTIQSTVSANTTAGFSIVKWTGTGSAATIGHGLGAIPAMMIVKRRNTANDWTVYHQGIDSTAPEDYKIDLNSTGGASNNNTIWNDTAPTSSVATLGTNNRVNGSSDTHVGYFFAEKTGYSKFGSYAPNGSADGNFIYTGFAPSFFLIKNTNTTRNWLIFDNKRNPSNQTTKSLEPNTSDAEQTDSNLKLDLLSNGAKLRGVGGDMNTGDGVNYIYMAFGQSLVGSNNIPCTAR